MKKLFANLLLCLMFIVSAFLIIKTPKTSVDFASASGDVEESTTPVENSISIFIRNPSFSVFFDNKIYFIDETDKLLKVYDKATDTFLSTYIDLSNYSIIETVFLNGDLYLMSSTVEKNIILKINLTNLEFTEIDIEVQNTSEYIYQTFFVQNITLDDKNYTLFTISGFRLSPVLALVDSESGDVLNLFDISFLDETIQTLNFVKVLSYQQSDGKAYLIFVYNDTIAYYSITDISSITDLESNSISSWSTTPIPSDLARISSSEDIIDIGFLNVNQKEYLSIFYRPADHLDDILRLYSFNFENQSGGTMNYETKFSCQNSHFANLNGNYFAFPNPTNQEIYLHNIEEISSDEGLSLLVYSDFVDNPDYDIDFYDFVSEIDSKDIYKTTIKTTELFSDPWGAKSDVIIDAGTDVLMLGNTKLEHGTDVNDYTYCMYSFAGENIWGFIKSSDITSKTELDNNYKPRVKVWPGTRLYSLPTNIASGLISSSSLNSKQLMQIEDNFEVEVLDTICGYIANGTRMIKVKVNGTHVGYIEEKCIHNPTNIVEFVITNATIQKDGTVVYHSASKDSSTLTFTLSEGKNVRINGKRNTSTGWTSITFNDEYGNEFTGYIETDFVKADAWSTMQIIGCVLIAINIGLLILILIYKKNHLGSHGQKITPDMVDEKK